MKKNLISSITVAIVFVFGLGSSVLGLAAGGKNAYNNPTGGPAEDTFQMPYMNPGEGRVMIFCAEGEVLVLTPGEDGSVQATCKPAPE